MADVKGLSILMNMRDVGVERSLKQIKAQFKTLSSEMSRSNNNFKNTERSMDSLSKRSKELNQGIEATENSMEEISNQLKKMTQEEQRTSVEAEKLRLEYSRQNKALDMYKRELNQTQNELKAFGKASQSTVFSMEKIDSVLGTLRKQLNITNMSFQKGGESTETYESHLRGLNTVIEKHKQTIKTLEARYRIVEQQQGKNSQEALELRQKILQEEQSLNALEGQYRQTSAQAQKFAMEQRTATMSLNEIRQKMNQLAQSLRLSATNFKLTGQTANAYEARISELNNGMKQQQLIVQNLSRQYNYAKSQYGATSEQAQKLNVELSEERLKLKNLHAELNSTTQAHNRLQMEQKQGVASVAELKARMTNMNNTLALSRSNFSRAGESVNSYKNHLNALKNAVSQQRTIIRELSAQYKIVAQTQGKNSQEARELATAINQQKIKMNELESELHQAGQAYTELAKKQRDAQNLGASGFGRAIQSVDKYKDRINSVGMAMRDIGSNMSMSLSLPIVAGFGVAIKKGMEFESQMAKVGAVAGANKSQLKAMTDQAVDLGSKSVFSASEVANGMKELSALGFDAKQTMSAIPGVIDAAAASGEDMSTTATIMASTMNSFGLEASKSGHIADVLAMSANKSAADVGYMGEALKYAGAPAHTLGMSLEDTSGAIMAMSNAGLKGEQAGTTLRASLIRLAKPTKQSQAAMDELGISITDSKGKFVGMPALVGQFQKGLQGMTRDQKLAAVSQVVGTESASGFLAMINAGQGKLNNYSKALKNSDGASKAAADKMNNTLKGAVEQLGGAFESLSIKLTQSNSGPLTALVKVLTNIISAITKLPGPVLQTITVFAGMVAAIGPLLMITGSVANGITGIASAVTLLNGTKGGAAFFSIFKNGLTGILPNLAQLLSKLPLIGTAMTFLTGPIGIAVAAIVAIGTAFVVAYKKSETFRNIVNAVIAPVKNSFMALWDVIKQFGAGIKAVFSGDSAGGLNIFKKILPAEAARQFTSTLVMIRGAYNQFINFVKTTSIAIGAFFKAFWQQNGTTIINAFNAIKTGVGAVLNVLFNVIIKPILTGIGNAFKIVFSGLKAIVINVFIAIRSIVQGGLTVIGGIINIFKGLFTGNFKLMWQGIKQVFSGALTAIGGYIRLTFGNLLIFLKTMGMLMLNAIKTVWTIIKNVVIGLVRILVNTAKHNFQIFKTAVLIVFRAILTVGRAIWTTIKNTIVGIVKALVTTVKVVIGKIKTFVTTSFNLTKAIAIKIWTTIKNNVIRLVKLLWNGIKNAVNNIRKTVTSVFNAVKSFAIKVWTAIKNKVIALARSLYNGVKKHYNTLKKITTSIFNSIKNFLSKVWTSIKNKVVSLVRTLLNGVRKHYNSLKRSTTSIFNSVKNFLYKIWTAIKNKVVSVAKKLWDSVKNTFNNMRNGIKNIVGKIKNSLIDNWNSIKSKVIGIAKGLWDKVKGTFNKMKDGLKDIIGKIKGHITGMVDAVKKGLNGLIKGLNWVGGKLGMEKIPKLSTGTQIINRKIETTGAGALKHGTMAVVGDKGPGNGRGRDGRREMIRYPNGKTVLTPSKDTTTYLPKGSSVINGRDTQKMLSTGTFDLPKLSEGTVWDKAKSLASWTGNKVKGAYDKAKEMVGGGKKWLEDKVSDVMDFMDKPGKLLDLALQAFGVDFSGFNYLIGDITKAAWKKIKKAAIDWIKSGLEAQGGDGSVFDGYKIMQPFSAPPKKPNPNYPFNGGVHYGIDFDMPEGTPVRTPMGGRVRKWYDNYGGGNAITVTKGKTALWFMHLSKQLKATGDSVKAGQLVGKSGNTGSMTNYRHLHFQVMLGGESNRNAIDPEPWLKKNSGGGGGKSGKWDGDVRKALRLAGLPTSSAYVNAWKSQIQSESSGNPKAYNLSGASGLVQVKPGTFAAYKLPGHGNIWNGLDNLIAGMRYAKATYKGRMLDQIGHGLPYATGGLINTEGWYNLAEGGYPEWVIPTDPNRKSDAMKLLALAAQDIQGRKYKNNKRPHQLSNPSNNSFESNNSGLEQKMDVLIGLMSKLVASNDTIASKDTKIELDGRELNRNNTRQQALNVATRLMGGN